MPRFSPALQLELIETYRATAAARRADDDERHAGPARRPTLANAVRTSRRCAVAISGGAVSPPALVRRIEAELGLRYSISLAQTESSCSITMASAADSADDRAETLGRPLPNTEVRIVDLRTGADRRLRRRRRDLRPRLPGDARLPQRARGDRRRHRRRRLAAHRRPRLDGRARLPADRRAAQGDDHPGRREHLPPRDRGGADQPPGRRRGVGPRLPRRPLRRGRSAAAIRPSAPPATGLSRR